MKTGVVIVTRCDRVGRDRHKGRRKRWLVWQGVTGEGLEMFVEDVSRERQRYERQGR